MNTNIIWSKPRGLYADTKEREATVARDGARVIVRIYPALGEYAWTALCPAEQLERRGEAKDKARAKSAALSGAEQIFAELKALAEQGGSDEEIEAARLDRAAMEDT